MTAREPVFKDETITSRLRALYGRYGYSQFRMRKFEEYDLYVRNKDFLISDSVITFTDTNGKLMALKPDVTFSIIKNNKYAPGTVQRYYYNENVYRVSKDTQAFKEIMQTGLECVGDVGMYDECEVIMLAARSLGTVSESYLLDLSHMGFLEGLFQSVALALPLRKRILGLMESKNLPGIQKLCAEAELGEALAEKLCLLAGIYLPLDKALEVIAPLVAGEGMQAAYDELVEIGKVMAVYGVSEKLYLDFSVVNDQNYYDGIIFKGFIDGIPDSVLSGGRYDRLLAKLGKKAKAIGFAVYLDRLERFGAENAEYDVDVMLLYGKDEDQKAVIDTVKALTDAGNTVLAARELDPSVRCRAVMRLENGEAKLL